jgi:C1A family cysteine protease
VEVTDQFRAPGPDGIVAIPDVRAASGSYHAVTCVGAATHPVSGRVLLVKNSWGTDWGLGGYCWLPIDYLVGFAVQAATIDDM